MQRYRGDVVEGSELVEENILDVPYYYQLDSEYDSQAGRMCFSSTNAMLVEYLNPGSLKGENGGGIGIRRSHG